MEEIENANYRSDITGMSNYLNEKLRVWDHLEKDSYISQHFENIPPITLRETNTLAQMLDRVDNKYVVNLNQLSKFISSTKGKYKVLEIGGRREFSYDSCYYDDHYVCYSEHHQGRRQRFKVRTREYVDGGGKIYFEFKLKGLRGRTEKHRMEAEYLEVPQISGDNLNFLKEKYSINYKKDMPFVLKPSLKVGYKRCTLVAVEGGERVTIDYKIRFSDPRVPHNFAQIGPDYIIVETKSGKGAGIADVILKQLKIKKASKCSKYCVGVGLLGLVKKKNEFLAVLHEIGKNIVSGKKYHLHDNHVCVISDKLVKSGAPEIRGTL